MKNNQLLASASVAVAIILGGCNSEGTSTSDTPPSPPKSNVSLSAENNIVAALNTQTMQVNLQGNVQLLVDGASSDFDRTSYIDSVTPVDDQPESCAQIAPNDSGFSVSYDGFVGTCVYQYSAANSQYSSLSADGYSLVVSEKHASNHVDTFRHLSKTLVLGDPDQEEMKINLKDELGSEVPEGYKLSPDATLVGPGSINVDSENQTITYQPADGEPGYAQIVYNYNNDGEVKLGTISVTISQSVNSAPQAPQIDYASDNGPLNTGQQVTVDLSKWVVDEDGDPLQLVGVSSWEASVSQTNPDDMNNLSFNFMSNKPGEHFVDYVVSDHLGGFATGTVRIAVVDQDQLANWSDINILYNDHPKVFIAPLTKSEADAKGVVYSGTYPEEQGENKVLNVATFNFKVAKDYCAAIGRLPTTDELVALKETGRVVDYGWPTQVAYYASDKGGPNVVSLKSGSVEPPTVGGQYVTCVQDAEFSILTDESKLKEIVANGVDTAKVMVKLEKNQKPVAGAKIQGEVTGNAKIENKGLVTNDQGEAEFHLTSIKAEDVKFTAEYENQGVVNRSTHIQFVADLDNLIIVDSGSTAENVYMSVEDTNGNKPNKGTAQFNTNSDDIVLEGKHAPMVNGTAKMNYTLSEKQSGAAQATVHVAYEDQKTDVMVSLIQKTKLEVRGTSLTTINICQDDQKCLDVRLSHGGGNFGFPACEWLFASGWEPVDPPKGQSKKKAFTGDARTVYQDDSNTERAAFELYYADGHRGRLAEDRCWLWDEGKVNCVNWGVRLSEQTGFLWCSPK